ncbi:hypothetical protein QUF70_16945 [Desulfobacterales bacterium HSG17]|nr:hypothetical protein [Desulfobacterales bacterium HSG17]
MKPLKKCRNFVYVIICCLCFACGIDDAVDYYLDGCEESGAQNLRQEHKDILEYAGWLEYVESNVGRLDYYDDRSASSEGAVGYAHCQPGECFIEIATKNRTDIEIATTIVHEAGHLDDDCESGEYWPEKMEKAFLEDLYAKYDAGELDALGTPVNEIAASKYIIDFYPYSKTAIALIIADNPANELQSNLYIYNSNTLALTQISHYPDKSVKFVKQYNDYPYSQFSYRLKNPWDLSGSNIAVSVEDDEYMIDIFNVNDHTAKTIYKGWASSGAIFSPDNKNIAIASRHVSEPIVIIDIETENIIETLPEKYKTSDGIMAWINNNTLALFNEDEKQIEKYNMDDDSSEILFELQINEINVNGIYNYGNDQYTVYAMVLTSQAERNIYRINSAEESRLLLKLDNDVVPAVTSSGDTTAYYINGSGDDSAYGKKLIIKNLQTGSETSLLDRVTEKDRLFFVDNDKLIMSTIYSPEGSSKHYYRLWIVKLSSRI